jgi:uncharacterized protein (DUF58 family)
MVDRRETILETRFLARLERLELNVRRLTAGDSRGETAARRRGAGTLFRDHRAYVAGDDARFVDWNALMRLDQLQIKTFQADESPRLLLLVDRSASMGLREESKLLQALRLGAAFAAIGLLRHHTVSCALIPGDGPVTFRGRGGLHHLLQHLASAEPRGEAHLPVAVQGLLPRPGPRGVALLLSDFFDMEEHGRALRFLQHRGFETHALHVTDERDLSVRAGEILEIVDVETGRTLRERVDRRLAASYGDAVRAHFASVEDVCRRHRVTYLRVDVAASLESAVVQLLRAGALTA